MLLHKRNSFAKPWKRHELLRFSICVNILDFCRIGFFFIRLLKDTQKQRDYHDCITGKDATIFYAESLSNFPFSRLPFLLDKLSVYLCEREHKKIVAKARQERPRSKQKKILRELKISTKKIYVQSRKKSRQKREDKQVLVS